MDLILDSLTRWGARLHSARRLLIALFALLFLGSGLVVASYFLASIPLASNTVGGLAGGAWFIAAFLVWSFVLPDTWRERTRVRGIYTVAVRRRAVLWSFLAWAGFLVFFGTAVADGPLLGALNVVVLLTLWRVFTMTAEERVALEAEENSTEDTWELPDGRNESDLELEEMFGDDDLDVVDDSEVGRDSAGR